jgi:Ca2+-binding EF-hand superfamily protein
MKKPDWLSNKQYDLNVLFNKLTYNPVKKKSSGVLLLKHINAVCNDILDMKLSDRQLRMVMKHMDKNGDGVVDDEDFWRAMLVGPSTEFAIEEADREAGIKKVWDTMDIDKDGKIGIADLETVNEKFGDMFYAANRHEVTSILQSAHDSTYGHTDKYPDIKDMAISQELFRKIALGKNRRSSTIS